MTPSINLFCAELDARGLAYKRDGNRIEIRGDLDLSSLTTVSEGVTLSAGRDLYLRSLTPEEQRYQGQVIRLRTIDGFTMRLISSRDVGGVTLWGAQYFRGDLDADPRCFVAQSGAVYAHGDTAESALRDLRFKIDQVNFDPDDLTAYRETL